MPFSLISNLVPFPIFKKGSVLLSLFPTPIFWTLHANQQCEMQVVICNGNWTVWSKMQGVISKLDERKMWGRFEIMSTITPWIVWHKVQLLIVSITNFGIKKLMSFKNCFWAKIPVVLLISFENRRKHWEGKWKSPGYPITGISCNWTPTWSRADYVTNRHAENQSWLRNLL